MPGGFYFIPRIAGERLFSRQLYKLRAGKIISLSRYNWNYFLKITAAPSLSAKKRPFLRSYLPLMDNKKRQSRIERLKYPYRLVVMNDETFEEVASYKLTLLNVYVLISTVIVLTVALVVSLIIFTPIKRYIPGYGTANANIELVRLNKQIEKMEKELETQRSYTENFRKILVGEVMTDESEVETSPEYTDTVVNVERIEEDEQLRQEIELEEIRELSRERSTKDLGSARKIPLEQQYFKPPITGEISAGFMPEKNHFGVDILSPKNTPIKAVMDGMVIQSDWTLETGNTIGIQHANNIISFYKHNSVLLKKVGSFVTAGEAIAIIGNTGTLSDGPHLHFELWHQGRPVNPVDYILF